jgi:hypothetical protein
MQVCLGAKGELRDYRAFYRTLQGPQITFDATSESKRYTVPGFVFHKGSETREPCQQHRCAAAQWLYDIILIQH